MVQAQELRRRINQIVKINEEMVEPIKRMRENNAETLKGCSEFGQLKIVHSFYGKVVESLLRSSVLLQRALLEDNDALRIDALDKSMKSFKYAGHNEILFSDFLTVFGENVKYIEGRIRDLNLETERLEKETQAIHKRHKIGAGALNLFLLAKRDSTMMRPKASTVQVPSAHANAHD